MNNLYVPFALEAFVCGNLNMKERQIAPVAPDFSRIDDISYLGGKLEPHPFDREKNLPSGVHLHFILPDAFTHAVEKEGEDGLIYPDIPNRWLVSRVHIDKNNRKLPVKSWLIESDYAGLDNTDSITIPTFDNTPQYCHLGRFFPIEFPPSLGTYVERLTAIGPGDPTFSAYYPSCRSVLGFHDALTDQPKGRFTYFVIGFYDKPQSDPLYGLSKNEWNAYLSANKWSLSDKGEQCDRIVCHGMLSDIVWDGPDKDYDTGMPKGNINMAVGNTSTEALSALIASQLCKQKNIDAGNLERFMDAMQYDLMDTFAEIDGIQQVENKCYQYEFEPLNGGDKWTVTPSSDDYSQNFYNTPTYTSKPEIPHGLGILLDGLNTSQAELDTLNRELRCEQDTLFSQWYSYTSLMESPPPPWIRPKPSEKEIVDEMNKTMDKLDRLLGTNKALGLIKVAQDNVNISKRKLEEKIGTTSLVLEQKNQAPFYAPKEPVILLGGDGIRRSFAFGQDGRLTKDGTLLCRTSCVSGLTEPRKAVSIDRNAINAYCVTSHAHMNIIGFPDLLCEAVCLSPEMVEFLCGVTTAKSLVATGQLPSEISCRKWDHSWITLFMEWKVRYCPTRTKTEPDNSIDEWTLEDIDFDYSGSPSSVYSSFSGRTVLTPHSPILLKNALQRNLDKYSHDPELYTYLKNALKAVENLSIVSQNLGGLNAQLLSKRLTLQLPILLGKGNADLTAKVKSYLEGAETQTIMMNSSFYPIRAGFMRVEEVNALSTFGQVQILTSSLNDTVFSEQIPKSENQYGLLTPRLVQGARFNFNWVSASDECIASSIDPATSPVCGFVMPDLLNHNLMFYDTNGECLGYIKLIYRETHRLAQWISAPDKPFSDFDSVNFSNPHLKSFAKSILSFTEKKDSAFYALMELIDSRLAVIHTQTNSDDLSALWGRPLVLARASLSLELYGNPVYSLNKDDFAAYKTYSFEQSAFHVHIGDITRALDGTVGYFAGADNTAYNKLYATHKSAIATDTKYISFDDGVSLSPADKSCTYITMLMEPGAKCHFTTGLLPCVSEQISAEHVQEPLSNLYLTMEINPILSEKGEIYLEPPIDTQGKWSWAYRDGDKYVINESLIPPQAVFHEERPSIIDGYLLRKVVEK